MLELRGVRHRYGSRVVLDLEHFSVPGDAQLAIVGPNGAGKSTLLRLLALLERPTEGDVLLDGRPARSRRREITLVEQHPILFHGTVRDNLGYGLRARRVPRRDAARRVESVASRLGLAPLLERRRHELSDGEVQRVAVARALVISPAVLLLDEPASATDRSAQRTLYHVLAEERRERSFAVCLVSHQLEDAYRWTDDIRALADGRLSPVTPENLFRVELPTATTDGLKHVTIGRLSIAVFSDKTGPAIVGIAPTDILVSRERLPSSARNVLPGRIVRLSRQRSGAIQVTADVGVELVALVSPEAVSELGLAPGADTVFTFKASAVRAF
jgi:molybdopterin-binding protein